MLSARLPTELLDHIADLLHDTGEALTNCCLISKSWIPRTRRHIFADVAFLTDEDLESWKETFPDPSKSPAHYTKNLSIDYLRVKVAEGEGDRWIGGFSRVVHLKVVALGKEGLTHHSILYMIAPTLPSSQIFDLVLSFPLLESLTMVTNRAVIDNMDGPDGIPTVAHPPPPMTGSLALFQQEGLRPLVRLLLSLPGGIHFHHLALALFWGEDSLLAATMVAECSQTIESLYIVCRFLAEPGSASIDLSKAMGLEHVIFRCESRDVAWITRTLQTITPEHRRFRQVSIYVPFYVNLVSADADVRLVIGEAIRQHWLDLDRLLVQFWESGSIRPGVICQAPIEEGRGISGCFGWLMPEATKRGIIDLVE